MRFLDWWLWLSLTMKQTKLSSKLQIDTNKKRTKTSFSDWSSSMKVKLGHWKHWTIIPPSWSSQSLWCWLVMVTRASFHSPMSIWAALMVCCLFHHFSILILFQQLQPIPFFHGVTLFLGVHHLLVKQFFWFLILPGPSSTSHSITNHSHCLPTKRVVLEKVG